jgi:hypothetical protein
MAYTPYTPTWQNPYLPINGPSSALGQSAIPAQQMQLTNGWQQHWHPVGGALKVNGYQSALQFGRGMPPNCESDPLFDAAGGVFYVVTTDGAGVPSWLPSDGELWSSGHDAGHQADGPADDGDG